MVKTMIQRPKSQINYCIVIYWVRFSVEENCWLYLQYCIW